MAINDVPKGKIRHQVINAIVVIEFLELDQGGLIELINNNLEKGKINAYKL